MRLPFCLDGEKASVGVIQRMVHHFLGATSKDKSAVSSTRPMVPNGGDDKIYTPSCLAKRIVDHFRPEGRILEPCKGAGAFLEHLPLHARWMEIDEGRDFLSDPPEINHYDWIVTNPPFSKLRHFLVRSMEQADDVVFLCNLNAVLGLKARMKAIQDAGFAIKEILLLDTPPKPWPQSGFQLGAIHIQRGYSGHVTLSQG